MHVFLKKSLKLYNYVKGEEINRQDSGYAKVQVPDGQDQERRGGEEIEGSAVEVGQTVDISVVAKVFFVRT